MTSSRVILDMIRGALSDGYVQGCEDLTPDQEAVLRMHCAADLDKYEMLVREFDPE